MVFRTLQVSNRDYFTVSRRQDFGFQRMLRMAKSTVEGNEISKTNSEVPESSKTSKTFNKVYEIPKVVASDLGNVYGLDFDKNGNLFAVGSDDQGSVLWKIASDRGKELYVRIEDPVEALSVAGISVHSKYLSQVAIDETGNVWISSSQYGACFIITAKNKNVIKLYLNTEYSISLEDDDFPFGVTWDGIQKRILLVTNGPEDQYSTKNIHHIHAIHFNAATSDYDGLYKGSKESIYFTKNDGTIVPFMGRDLIKSKSSSLFFVGSNCVYKVKESGDFNSIGKKQETKSFWAGTMDEKDNLYLTANKKDYKIGTGNSRGYVYRLTPAGNYELLTTEIKEPLGIAINNGLLYITDRSKGAIVVMKL